MTTTTDPVPSDSAADFVYNVEKLDEIVSGGALTYTDRLGVVRSTAAGVMARFAALNPRGAWVTATVYQPRDLVLVSGTWYIALDAHTSGATFAGDLTAHWRPEQGVTRAELADPTSASNGAGIPAFNDALNYLPPSSGASIRARGAVVTDKPYLADNAGATNSRTAVQAAISTGRDVHFVPGTFDCTGSALNFTTAGQTIHLHGATLKISQINVTADNVTFDIGGGLIKGPLKVGQLASPAAVGQNQLQLVSAAEFSIGDQIWCSYGDNISNFPLATPTAITAISGNTVTLASNLIGSIGLPTGVYVGTFSFNALVGNNAAKNLRFINGKITRAPGYFLYTWRWNQPDFLTNIPTTYCFGIDFDESGLDQFLCVRAKQVFVDCSFGVIYDVAKQGFVYGDDAQIVGVRCRMARGNYDMDFLPISDAGRSTYFQGTDGKIAFADSYFNGANKLPGSTYFNENALHCINWASGGAPHDGSAGSPSAAHFVEISFARCRFENYTRSLFSTTVIADNYSSVVDRVTFEDCQIGTQLFQLKAVSGKTLAIKSFNVSKSAVFSNSAAYELTLAQNTQFVCNILQSYIKATGTIPELVSSRMVDSTIDASPGFWLSPTSECVDVVLTGGTKVGPRFTYSTFPVKGSFVVDSTSFAATPGFLTAFLALGADPTSIYGQASGATVKSSNGSLTYSATRQNTDTLCWASVSESGPGGVFKGLSGDDWMLGLGARVNGFGGAVYKSTYALAAALSANADASAASITVNSISFPGNRPAIGDFIFMKMNDGTVFVTKIAGGWDGSSLTIPISPALPSASSSANGLTFLRLVQL